MIARAGCDTPNFMNILKRIGRTIVNLVEQAWHLPRTVALVVQLRRLHNKQCLVESERLDRIRNPSKYLGK